MHCYVRVHVSNLRTTQIVKPHTFFASVSFDNSVGQCLVKKKNSVKEMLTSRPICVQDLPHNTTDDELNNDVMCSLH